jgi:hypothetical protein
LQGVVPRPVSLLSYAILLGGILTMGISAYLVVVSYSSLPCWDGWTQVSYAAHGGDPFTLGWLWKQHNEHRMPIPKLLLLADLRWFRASLLASIFVIQLLQLWVLARSMRVFGTWRGPLWRSGVGLAAFGVFCPSQWENLSWGFQVCFVLPGLFATASFFGLLSYWKASGEPSTEAGSSWKYLPFSIAAALGATRSLVNGNLLWPILLAAALLLRLRLTAVVGYAISGVLTIVVYLQSYLLSWYAMNSLRMPANMLRYLAAYFGSSWVEMSFRLAEILGFFGLLVFLLLLSRLPSYIRRGRALNVQLVLISLFCFGTGLLTAFGRSGFGINQAFTSRYQTISLLFWCCLGLLLLEHVSAIANRNRIPLLLWQLVVLGIMMLGAERAELPLTRARVRDFKLNAAAMSLVMNVPDFGATAVGVRGSNVPVYHHTLPAAGAVVRFR